MSQPEPDISTVRQTLLNECDSYVYNNLPAYLLDIRNIHNPVDRIRLSDIQLVSRSQISEEIRTQIEANLRTIPKILRKEWCEARIHEYKSKHFYAILSHCHWGDGEPEFQQMCKQEQSPEEQELPAGIRKLLGFCRVAATEYGCPYAWSDTCCIDKKSSSELDEAIRSMYRWYRGSEICIVYLGASSLLDDLKDDPWFKRGWTLQELLAPRKIKFYGKDWRPINCSSGTQGNDKEDDSMRRTVAKITGIPGEDIREFRPSRDRVSEKMRWMAPRQTRRDEDIAYSLIGIFDVTMGIAYGEGTQAFQRFMRVLADRCYDPGFLAWCGDPSPGPYSHALPMSPSCYQLDEARATLLELGGFNASQVHGGDPSYTVKKMGLEVKVLIVPIDESNPSSLDCTYILPAKRRIAIPVDGPNTELTWRRRFFSAKRGRSLEALGVVNYHQVSPGRGKVSAKSNYFCLLLKRHDSKSWSKNLKGTKSVVLLKCEGTFEDKVETIMLFHDSRLSESYP